jgi:hypothetical protein
VQRLHTHRSIIRDSNWVHQLPRTPHGSDWKKEIW